MVTLKSSIKKIVALLLMLTMVLTVVPCVASATGSTDPALINPNATGSITVTKYATANSSRPGNAGTGMSGQTLPDAGYTTLNGAKFVLYKIANKGPVEAYYNGTDNTQYDLALFDYNRETKEATYKYDGTTPTLLAILAVGTTAGSGTYTFTGLEVGIYALVEDTAPDQITVPLAENSLISIPMVNTATSGNNDNAEWIYDIYVYPKNHESTGTVELTKQDQNGAGLNNATFALYKAAFQSTESGLTLPKNENGIIWTEVNKTIDNSGSDQNLVFTTATIESENGKLILANLPAGLYGTQYKLVEVSVPDGYIVNQTPLYFKVNNDNTITWNASSGDSNGCNNTNTGVLSAAQKNGDATTLQITLRNERPSLTKEVQENGGNTWKTDEQYRLDDAITYRLIAYVPNNVTEITYEIKDLPQVGITDSANSSDYTVTYGNTADTCADALASDKYTWSKIDASGTNGQGFKLTLKDGTAAGKFIQIEYKAHMNDKAVIAGNGNGNTATLTYSKYIGNSDRATYAITDEARVYTYQYQITKRKDSATGEVAEGVEFNLLYKADGTAIDVFKEADGVYRLWLASDVDTSKKTTTLTTKADGTILIQGLENDTYYLKETKTVNGYNLLSQPFEITLHVTETTTWSNDGTFSSDGQVVKTYGSTAYDVTNAMGTSTIINKKGFVLPQTGSMGYLLFCTVGIVLIGGGAALIFGGRKKKIR